MIQFCFSCFILLSIIFKNFCFATVVFDGTSLQEGRAFKVTISTQRLILRSIQKEDFPFFLNLFQDSEVMEKFASGVPWTIDVIRSRFYEDWLRVWEQGGALGAFSIFLKKFDHKMVGAIFLEPTEDPRKVEISYLFFKDFWHQGYGLEAVQTMIRDYVNELILRKYNTLQQVFDAPGSEITHIVATASPDNLASCKILDVLGFECASSELLRCIYPSCREGSDFYNVSIVSKENTQKIRTLGKRFGVTKCFFSLPVTVKEGSNWVIQEE